jgi:DNA polymerase-4
MTAPAAAVSTILHVDMDAFFAAVELRRRPELRGQPVVVGGDGARGVVAAASYEARYFGIHSAMSSVVAKRRCPHAVFIPGDMGAYVEASDAVFAIFNDFTPLVEPLSLDEAFLDVTGSQAIFGDGAEIGRQIRQRVLDELELPCAVGVATSKLLAKLASKGAKPTPTRRGPEAGIGVLVVEPGTELDYLHPQPIEALWGVGPKTGEKLRSLGLTTVGDLAECPPQLLERTVGSGMGRTLQDRAWARDQRPVVAGRKAKSISHEETFSVDRFDHDALGHELVKFADAVASRLRASALAGRTVVLKVRYGDFETITRSATPGPVLRSAGPISAIARELLAQVDPTRGVRLLGLGVSNLADDPGEQLSLLSQSGDAIDYSDSAVAESDSSIDSAVDAIRERFGSDAIGPASVRGGRTRSDGVGAQPWGPGEVDRVE